MTAELPCEVAEILDRLHERGYQAYPVGGCVRDRLLGFAPTDYDLCTSALPSQMLDCFSDGEYKVYETGLRHGTLTVVLRGVSCEVTTFRRDGEYTDARHPDQVSFIADLADDLSRRDFTVNAMALDADGGVIDLFGGQADLAAGVIRAVGDPEKRFREDALRILRALRFASRLDFAIEAQTAKALRTCGPLLAHISRERIAVELAGIVMGKAAEKITRDNADVIAFAIPDPAIVPDGLPRDEVIRMAALCLRSPDAVGTLKLSCQLRHDILALIRSRSRPLPRGRAEALYLLYALGPQSALRLCQMRADRSAEYAVRQAEKSGMPYRVSALAVNGNHLLALGVPQTRIGALLDRALRAVMAGAVENRKDNLLAYLTAHMEDIR